MNFLKIIISLIIGTILLAGYAFKIEPALTTFHSYNLNGEKNSTSESLKVVQLSDIQVSESYSIKQLDRLIEKVNRLSPDIILFTGDLFDNFAKYKPVQEITESLSKLHAPYGKYAIWGNRDYGGGAANIYEHVLTNSGFVSLKNSGINLTITNGKKIFIGGLDDAIFGNPDIDSMLAEMDADCDYKIALMHEPDIADGLKDSPINLALAGHSHGGQVRIPFVKKVTTSFAEKYTKGFYTLNERTGAQLYVNVGIGTSHLPIRFMVPPEISVFNINL